MRVSSRNFYAVNSTILFDNEIFLLVFFLLQYNEIDCLHCKLNFLFNFLLTAALKKTTSLFYLFLQKTTPSSFASFVYDAVWVYALALNTLLESDPIAVKHLHSDENTRLV